MAPDKHVGQKGEQEDEFDREKVGGQDEGLEVASFLDPFHLHAAKKIQGHALVLFQCCTYEVHAYTC